MKLITSNLIVRNTTINYCFIINFIIILVNVSIIVRLEISRKKTWKPQEEGNYFGTLILKC